MRGRSVNCTEAGCWTSTVRKNKTASSDSLIPLVCMLAGSGMMVGLNISLSFIVIFSSANDVADEGVLVHARDNSDLTWINHLYSCGSADYMFHFGNDYYILGLHGENEKYTGAWCDVGATYAHAYFICEGFI